MKTKTQPINTGYAVIYNQRKRTRKEYLRKNNLISKKPWYTLTKSELKAINKNKIAKPMGEAKFMESTVQHKLSKWIKKNPKPNDKQNLFYKEFTEDWEKEKEKKLQHYRYVTPLTSRKLKVYGFYSHQDEDGNYQYKTKLLKIVKDKRFESVGVKMNCLNENTRLRKILHDITLKKSLENEDLRRTWIETPNGIQLYCENSLIISNYYTNYIYGNLCDDKKEDIFYNKNVYEFRPIVKNSKNKLYTCKLHNGDIDDITRKIKGPSVKKEEMNKIADEIINKVSKKYNCVGVIYGCEFTKIFEKRIAA